MKLQSSKMKSLKSLKSLKGLKGTMQKTPMSLTAPRLSCHLFCAPRPERPRRKSSHPQRRIIKTTELNELNESNESNASNASNASSIVDGVDEGGCVAFVK